jgi:hypothetical protein
MPDAPQVRSYRYLLSGPLAHDVEHNASHTSLVSNQT